jgi:hypothetical protein
MDFDFEGLASNPIIAWIIEVIQFIMQVFKDQG